MNRATLIDSKDRNNKIFNMVRSINEVKTLVKHISYCCKYNAIVLHAIKIKNEIMINVNVSVKIIIHAKKIIY